MAALIILFFSLFLVLFLFNNDNLRVNLGYFFFEKLNKKEFFASFYLIYSVHNFLKEAKPNFFSGLRK